jgi:hypothetical protein
MHIVSALRRKRDEIAASIAACEARIVAARMDLAALDHAARLFDAEAGRDEAALHWEQPDEAIASPDRQFTAKLSPTAPQAPVGHIPGEFFYLDWP